MGILTNIRQYPDNQKKIISLVTAIVLTLIIVGFWYSFSGGSAEQKASAEPDRLSSVSPWQVIKDEFSRAFSGFGSTSSPQVILNSSSTVPVEVIEATSTGESISI